MLLFLSVLPGFSACERSPVEREGCLNCHGIEKQAIGPSFVRIAEAYCESGSESLAHFLDGSARPRLSGDSGAMKAILAALRLDRQGRLALAEDVLKKGGCRLR
ncbi:MAG: hypothetical protein KDK25_09195 [Leptospiraceae bacterium]|nr:hypothetical protein [Leptospiraceae bacterium]